LKRFMEIYRILSGKNSIKGEHPSFSPKRGEK
jgi:hypothetical protein